LVWRRLGWLENGQPDFVLVVHCHAWDPILLERYVDTKVELNPVPTGVESFVIDSTQDRLFALFTKGEIEMYHIEQSAFYSKGRYNQLRDQLVRDKAAGPAPDFPGARIVSIAPITKYESKTVCLVVVTAGGECAV
jgi:hypothetical protein